MLIHQRRGVFLLLLCAVAAKIRFFAPNTSKKMRSRRHQSLYTLVWCVLSVRACIHKIKSFFDAPPNYHNNRVNMRPGMFVCVCALCINHVMRHTCDTLRLYMPSI